MWIGTDESHERRNAVPSFPVELETFGGAKWHRGRKPKLPTPRVCFLEADRGAWKGGVGKVR